MKEYKVAIDFQTVDELEVVISYTVEMAEKG